MGDLPEKKTTPLPPFTYIGVDFTGAFTVKDFQTKDTFKCYMALFVCFSTKAIHLELVSSLSTPLLLHCAVLLLVEVRLFECIPIMVRTLWEQQTS